MIRERHSRPKVISTTNCTGCELQMLLTKQSRFRCIMRTNERISKLVDYHINARSADTWSVLPGMLQTGLTNHIHTDTKDV